VSGIGAHDAADGIPESAEEQAEAALSNLEAYLLDAGSSLAEIVWFRPLVTSRDHMAAIDKVLDARLPHPRPACGALLVAGLADPRMKIEFEAWAHRGAELVERP
ncbi:Rid family hydrolase, partial [Streptomyces sp. NPDC006356]